MNNTMSIPVSVFAQNNPWRRSDYINYESPSLTSMGTKTIDPEFTSRLVALVQQTIREVNVSAFNSNLAFYKATASGAVSATTYPMNGPASIARKWDQVFANIDELSELADGWNGYNAPSPNENSVSTAKRFLYSMKEFGKLPTRIAASAVGGIGITQRNNNRKVCVEFFNNSLINALFADDTNETMHTLKIENTQKSFRELIMETEDYLHG